MKLKVTKSEHPSFKKGDVVEANNPQWLDNKYIISGVGNWTFFANRSGNRFSIGGKFGDPIVNLVPVKPELSDYEKAKRRDMWIEIGVVAVASIILLVAGFMK
jgi:hypothetical protein